jgi:superfamily II DNA or RNA helicase
MNKFTPFDYQVGMIQHLVDQTHAGLFAQMGLGKTVTTLEAYRQLRERGDFKGVLIIAPLRVCSVTWPDQVMRWQMPFKVANLRTDEGKQAWLDGTADIYLINFELVSGRGSKKGFLDEYVGADMPVDTLLVDELSCLKANSKRTKAVIKARKHFKRVHGLTGTPSPNGLLDLFYQLKVIDGGARLGKFITHFKNKWFDSDWNGWNWTPKPSASAEINSAIADICLVRRSQQHLDIPDCNIIDVDVTLPVKVMKQYKALEKHLVIQIAEQTVDAQSAATLVNKLQQFTAGTVYDEDGECVGLHTAKHKHLHSILSKSKGKPVLVLTRYKSEMQALLEAFPQAEQFDEKRMSDWRAGKIPCWIANPASLSHGIDGIQDSCSTIVWMSLTYSLEQYEQTNARILRTGQKKTATIHRIMAVDTIDWTVASALENKADGQSTLMASIGMLQRANSSEHQSGQQDKPRDQRTSDPLDFLSRRGQ